MKEINVCYCCGKTFLRTDLQKVSIVKDFYKYMCKDCKNDWEYANEFIKRSGK